MDRKWVVALFTKLRAIYPKKFMEQYQGNNQLDIEQLMELSMNEWAQGLSGLSGDDVKRALDHCRDNLAWPPSIAEFRQIAKDYRPPKYIELTHDKPELTPEEKLASLEKFRKMKEEMFRATT
jgi:hypothetical protein